MPARRVELPATIARQLNTVLNREAKAALALADARLATAARFAALADAGYSVRVLAEASGLSVGLVHQLIREGRFPAGE